MCCERPTKSHGSLCCLQFHQDGAFICDSSQCNWSDVGESVGGLAVNQVADNQNFEQDAPICFAVNADADQPQCVRELQIQISALSQFLQIVVRLVFDSENLLWQCAGVNQRNILDAQDV